MNKTFRMFCGYIIWPHYKVMKNDIVIESHALLESIQTEPVSCYNEKEITFGHIFVNIKQ